MEVYLSKIDIQKRMTPEQLAEFILKKRVCKNCKWNSNAGFDSRYCMAETPVEIIGTYEETFSCNQWEKKG